MSNYRDAVNRVREMKKELNDQLHDHDVSMSAAHRSGD